jgi:hypothetical protein
MEQRRPINRLAVFTALRDALPRPVREHSSSIYVRNEAQTFTVKKAPIQLRCRPLSGAPLLTGQEDWKLILLSKQPL